MVNRIDKFVAEYGSKPQIYLYLYSSILIIGSIVSLVFSIDNHDPFSYQEGEQPSDDYLPAWLKPGNYFNFIFTDGMPIWYLAGIAFIAIYVYQVRDTAGNNPKKVLKNQLKRVFQIFLSWTLFIALKKVIPYFFKFNISGHFMTLTSSSISLMSEYFLLLCVINDDNAGLAPNIRHMKTFIQIYLMVILITWYFILFVTSVFYHTFLEKLFGQMCAFLSLYYVYSETLDSPSETGSIEDSIV